MQDGVLLETDSSLARQKDQHRTSIVRKEQDELPWITSVELKANRREEPEQGSGTKALPQEVPATETYLLGRRAHRRILKSHVRVLLFQPFRPQSDSTLATPTLDCFSPDVSPGP